MGATIDAVDYAVLECLSKCDGCWKKCIHQWISDNIDELPIQEEKSVQTIGRRVDRLHEEGLVESCILSPDAVERDMIIGYKLTDDGVIALRERRNEFLREMIADVSKDLLTAADHDGDTTFSVEREPLIHLMTDVFDIDDETRNEVLPELETEELISLLATHFFLDNSDGMFNPDHEDAVLAFLEQTPAFRRPFEEQTILSRIRDRLMNAVQSGQVAVQSATTE